MNLHPVIQRRRYALVLGDILGPVPITDHAPASDLWGDDEPFTPSFGWAWDDASEDEEDEPWQDEPPPRTMRVRGPSPPLVPVWELGA